MKKIIWIVVVIVIIAVIIGITRGPDEIKNTEPIKIGVVAAFSGDAAPYGEPVKHGVTLAVEEINAAGGVNGRQIEAIYEDGRCDGKTASSATQKLISIDKVKVIIGMPCSGEVLASAPISEASKTLLLVQGSSPDITKAGSYIFRVFPSDAYTGVAIAEKMITHNFKNVAIITENTPYAVGIEKTFSEGLIAQQGKIVAKETYNPDVKDFRSLLLKIKATNPEALFINAQTGASGARIAQQARDMGMKSQFYTAFFSGPDFVKAGSFVEGTYIVDVPTVDSTDQDAQDFLKKYTAKTNNTNYIIFAGGAYDETMLLAKAIEEVGYEDTDKIKSYLHGISNYDGVIGNFSFDSEGDVVGINLRWMQIKDGELQTVK